MSMNMVADYYQVSEPKTVGWTTTISSDTGGVGVSVPLQVWMPEQDYRRQVEGSFEPAFWICPYCRSAMKRKRMSCKNCGASRED